MIIVAFCSEMIRDASAMKCSGFFLNCANIAGLIP